MIRSALRPLLAACAAIGCAAPLAQAQSYAAPGRTLQVVPGRVYVKPLRAPRTAPTAANTGRVVAVPAAPRTVQGYYQTQAVSPAPMPTANGLAPSPMLGTFYPDPQLTVGGNFTSGGSGYTPMSGYGWGSMNTYGPFSAFRATAAPVTTYSRGYNGVVNATESTSFSYPFQPAMSPVTYPNRGQQRGAAPVQYTPPSWDSGFNWVDQN